MAIIKRSLKKTIADDQVDTLVAMLVELLETVGGDGIDFDWEHLSEYKGVDDCVEIKQCVGCTRRFFTKSFLGDDAAVLAQSSGEEPASPRHRAGVAPMAWRSTR